MLKNLFQQLKTALSLLIILSILTGLIYPFFVTGLAQLFFPWQANGSLIKKNDVLIGSLLIGQSFNSPIYFWGRPSATRPFPYDGASSSGSNLGPSNPELVALIKERIARFKKIDVHLTTIPVDLVTASGSGLDPEISPLAAMYQVPRIAKYRKIPEKNILALVYAHVKNRTFYILGEPRVNVLELNLALDDIQKKH